MGFRQFYKNRLSPFVTVAALFIGIHLSWWSIQQKLAFDLEKINELLFFLLFFFFLSPALIPGSDRRRDILGIRIPYLEKPIPKQKETKNE